MRLTRIVSCAVLIAASVFFAPGAQAAPTPVSSCGTTAITDVVVTADLSCTGDGIVVGADEITIDLGGHVLDGDLGAGDFGVDNSGGFDKVKVVNGVVRNFQYGIRGDNGADKMAVKDVVVSGNAGFGIVIGGASASVKSATASGNGNSILIFGDSASVKSVTASGNGGSGIDIVGASASVKSVIASGNGASGIFITGTSASVKSVIASGNGSVGIRIDGASASVKSVTASGNGNNGIFIDGDAPVISGNTANANSLPAGASNNIGQGVSAIGFTTAPTGLNVALGNDDPAECSPASLCEPLHAADSRPPRR